MPVKKKNPIESRQEDENEQEMNEREARLSQEAQQMEVRAQEAQQPHRYPVDTHPRKLDPKTSYVNEQGRVVSLEPPPKQLPKVASDEDYFKIKRGPGIGFNASTISGMPEFTDDTKGYLEPARAAFEAAQEQLDKLWGAYRDVASFTAWSDDKKIFEVADAARKVEKTTTSAFAKATDALNKIATSLSDELTQSLQGSAAHGPMAGEVRTMIRTELKAGERLSFIQKAIADGDESVVVPVLGASPKLSGLTAEQHAVLTKMYWTRAKPEIAVRLAAIQKGLDRLNEFGPKLFQEVESVVYKLHPNNSNPLHPGQAWGYVDKLKERYSKARISLDKIA